MVDAQVERDDIEDDWEILRRDPNASAFPTTISMAEAVERICKAMVDYAIQLDGRPEQKKRELETSNKFPIFSIIPFFSDNKRLWKVSVTYEELGDTHTSFPQDCCEKAVEQLFQFVTNSLTERAIKIAQEADSLEQKSTVSRSQARKIKRIATGMGDYNLKQPNLPLAVKTSPEEL